MYISGSIASSQRALTEIKKSGTIAKIAKTRISLESDTVKQIRSFRIISGETPISLLILR